MKDKAEIEIYGKEIKTDKGKFISCSCKGVEIEKGKHEFINVRFVKDSGYTPTKGLQKVSFNFSDSNVKEIVGTDGKKHKVLYIKKATRIPYTEEEEREMKQRQAEKVAQLFE